MFCQIASIRRLVTFLKASSAFFSACFSNWNNVLGCFEKYEQSECHLEALHKLNLDTLSTFIAYFGETDRRY